MKTIGLIAILVSGLALPVAAAEVTATNSMASCCARPVPVAPVSDQSLYQTESTWTTDAGKKVQLADLRGRPQVVVMFFASCTYACPILVHDLRRIESGLPPALRTNVGFTLVTIDPKRDTPAALAEFRSIRSLPAETWTLLHGPDDDILELAALLGVKYKQEANGQFAHSNLITLLNEQGEIVHQLVGLGQDVAETVKAIHRMFADREAAAVKATTTAG
jgi:protein SCO1/2